MTHIKTLWAGALAAVVLAVMLAVTPARVYAQLPVDIIGAALTAIQAIQTAVEGTQDVNVVTIAGSAPVYDPCGDPDKQVRYTNAALSLSTSSTQLVALDGSDLNYICGYTIQASAAGTITMNFGDGTACSTNTVAWEIVRVGSDGGGVAIANTGVTQARSAAGMQICALASASITGMVRIAYVQEPAPS